MRHPERIYFEELKKQMIVRFRERHPDCPTEFAEWTGKVIEDFQTDLEEKVKGRISTRWFYDHLKSDRTDRIPRIDILNLLATYSGHDSWEYFKEKTQLEAPLIGEAADKKNQSNEVGASKAAPSLSSRRKLKSVEKAILLIGLLLVATILITLSIGKKTEYTVCFVDADFGIPIVNKNLEIMLLEAGHNSAAIKADSNGCVNLALNKSAVTLVVHADYYRIDTLKVNLENGEAIPLKVDDYSLLIHQLSVTHSDDWDRRRKQLEEMIKEDAVIFLVAKDNQGIEMYNREEFIDRMTMPISALKNISILQTEYRDGKIYKMRITQEPEDE